MILEQKMYLNQDFSKNIGVVQDPAREPEKMLKNSSFGKKKSILHHQYLLRSFRSKFRDFRDFFHQILNKKILRKFSEIIEISISPN